MRQRLNLFAAALLVSCAATTSSADPVFKFEELQDTLPNQHFGSNVFLEVGLINNVGHSLGLANDKNFTAIGPRVDFMSEPAVCVQAPAVTMPEPATMILLGTGLIGVGAVVRRVRKSQKLGSKSAGSENR